MRDNYRSGQTENISSLKQIVAGLPPSLSQAIRTGDVTAIENEVMPPVQADPTLAEWLSQPDVGDWLTSYLQKIRVELGGEWNEPDTIARSIVHSQFIEDDVIV